MLGRANGSGVAAAKAASVAHVTSQQQQQQQQQAGVQLQLQQAQVQQQEQQQQQARAPAEPAVPATWPEVQAAFWGAPGPRLAVAGIAAALAARVALCDALPLGAADAGLCLAAICAWLLQEWAVHKYLLHSSWGWFGRDIHTAHHERPYHHISLDSPGLLGGVMAAAAGAAALLCRGSPVCLSATTGYFAAGLLYEWLHYVVHTRWLPPASWGGGLGSWLRAVRRHHMLHHCRNEGFWLSFSAPQVDALFGTLPPRGSAVPLSDMARRAHAVEAAVRRAAASRAHTAGSQPQQWTVAAVPAPPPPAAALEAAAVPTLAGGGTSRR